MGFLNRLFGKKPAQVNQEPEIEYDVNDLTKDEQERLISYLNEHLCNGINSRFQPYRNSILDTTTGEFYNTPEDVIKFMCKIMIQNRKINLDVKPKNEI